MGALRFSTGTLCPRPATEACGRRLAPYALATLAPAPRQCAIVAVPQPHAWSPWAGARSVAHPEGHEARCQCRTGIKRRNLYNQFHDNNWTHNLSKSCSRVTDDLTASARCCSICGALTQFLLPPRYLAKSSVKGNWPVIDIKCARLYVEKHCSLWPPAHPIYTKLRNRVLIAISEWQLAAMRIP
jgi:hypothetical protein